MLSKVSAYIKRGAQAFATATRSRTEGLEDEVRFWDEWFRTKGPQWPDDYQNRINPDLPLSEYHRRFIDHLPQEETKILDVGAGPLTLLGKRHPSKRLMIQATDVLAEKYDELLLKYSIHPAVKTTFAEAEKPTDKFAENTFDLVNARNCLDHAVNPLEAVRQMLLVTKKGCFAVLDHAENEGENQGYHGLHQWNLTVVDGDFIVKGKGHAHAVNVSRRLAHLGDFQCSVKDKWVSVHIRKK